MESNIVKLLEAQSSMVAAKGWAVGEMGIW